MMLDVADLSTPQQVMARLESIEHDLAIRQNALENAAREWFTAKREIERERARALLSSEASSVTEKKAQAEIAAGGHEGIEFEAEYEALKSVVRVLETRATVCMALLKSQGRT